MAWHLLQIGAQFAVGLFLLSVMNIVGISGTASYVVALAVLFALSFFLRTAFPKPSKTVVQPPSHFPYVDDNVNYNDRGEIIDGGDEPYETEMQRIETAKREEDEEQERK
jgi:hypothetical protein